MSEAIYLAVLACIACAAISVVAAVVAWRQMANQSGELRSVIANGDKAVMEHADRTNDDVREVVEGLRAELSGVHRVVSRIEAQQGAEDKHALRRADLEPIYSKVNRLAEQYAETRGELNEVARMLREQLRILQMTRPQ